MTALRSPEMSVAFRPAPDSRPPTFDPRLFQPRADLDAQPTLPLGPHSPLTTPPAPGPVAQGAVDPVIPLLAAEQWGATLALAVFETLHGRRPVGQLTRWVDDRVQAAIAFHRRRAGSTLSGRPASLHSVRVQYPRPDAAEVCAHLAVSGRSFALALRLDIWGDRWLCTALAF